MEKINKFELKLDNTKKMPMGNWDILHYKLLANSRELNNSCELLLPTQKFIKDTSFFLNENSDSFKIDSNDGSIVISLKRFEKDVFVLDIKDGTNNAEYDYLIDINYFLKQYISFFCKVINIFIPNNNEDKIRLENLKLDLRKIQKKIENEK